jgi:tetratricopeptide (TPR) repeat protein
MTLLITLLVLAGAQNKEYDRARDLLASGHAAEAAKIYHDLAASDPRNASLLLNASVAEYKARQFQNSAESAAAALRLQPDLALAHLFLGASYLALGDFAKAAGSLQRAVSANPADRNAQLMLGEALLESRQPEAAYEHLRVAADAMPQNSRVWYDLGRAAEGSGREEPAREAWERLASLPPSIESHLHAAELNDADHRWREAARERQEALRLAPENLRIRTGLAWSLFRCRDYEQAMSVLQPLLTDDALAEVRFMYGASLLNLQQPADAMPYLRAALARDPHMLPASAALGQALLQTGKPEEAIPYLEQAAPADEDGTTHFQLFRAYQLTNQPAKAREALAGYQRLRASP